MSQYFLFGMKFEYFFYSAWCNNQGGFIATPSSTETYHEIMDIADSLKNKDIHEKCFAGSGALVIWTGVIAKIFLNILKLLSLTRSQYVKYLENPEKIYLKNLK